MNSHRVRRFLTFAFFGGINTAATYLLYIGLSKLLHYQAAYFIAYASGIALAYVLNIRYVFKEKSSLGKIACYPLIYAVQYALGAGMMYLLLEVLMFSNAVAPLIVTGSLIPIAYFMNRMVLVNR